MRININKKLKIGLISILVIMTGIISFLLYKEIKYPGFEEQKTPVYTYNNKANVNYKVFTKPNKLYDINPLEEGKLYITEYVDYINTTFNYEFTGERNANLKGNYSIIGKVQGFTKDGENIINIWEKDFPIIRRKDFAVNSNSKSIMEEIRINLDEYNIFVKEIIETSKINCQTALTVTMDIDLEGETDKGSIKEIISPSLIIPLNTNMFQISGSTNIEKPGVIEETRQIQLPINKNQVIIYGIILGILLIGLILVIFLTKVVVIIKDPLEKMLKQIFKKHGDRLVALNNDDLINTVNASEVKSIDDLVRIADEIGKPIMYKYSSDYNEIKRFYITDENDIYVLDIDNIVTNDNQNKEIPEKVTSEDME